MTARRTTSGPLCGSHLSDAGGYRCWEVRATIAFDRHSACAASFCAAVWHVPRGLTTLVLRLEAIYEQCDRFTCWLQHYCRSLAASTRKIRAISLAPLCCQDSGPDAIVDSICNRSGPRPAGILQRIWRLSRAWSGHHRCTCRRPCPGHAADRAHRQSGSTRKSHPESAYEQVDLTLLAVDQTKLPVSLQLRRMPLCQTPPWAGEPVIVAIPESIAQSTIMSPRLLPPDVRTRFTTVISDVATTGNSGSGVFDADRGCLLGIMSRKIIGQKSLLGMTKQKDIAKYFVPAATIAAFIPSEYRN